MKLNEFIKDVQFNMLNSSFIYMIKINNEVNTFIITTLIIVILSRYFFFRILAGRYFAYEVLFILKINYEVLHFNYFAKISFMMNEN